MCSTCQLQVIPVMEGILVGLANIEQDLTSCMNDPGQVISSFQSAVAYIQQGITVDNLVNAFEQISNAINSAKEGFTACEGVVDSYETLYAEFENIVGVFENPFSFLWTDFI